MLYREIIVVCSEIHTKHINTLCGQNVELNVKPGGTYSDHWTLERLDTVHYDPTYIISIYDPAHINKLRFR